MDRPSNLPAPDNDRQLRAAELALGLVAGEDRAAELSRDPALAGAVARWEEDLARLGEELAPVPPSPQVWIRLNSAIDADRASPVPLNPARETSPRQPLMQRLTFWRALATAGFAAAGVATAAALMLLAMLRMPDAPASQPAVAEGPAGVRALLVSPLLPRDGYPLYVATYDEIRATIVVVPAATGPSAGGKPQLWLVPNDTGEPIALGVLDSERPSALALAPAHARQLDANAGLVITIEPSETVTGAAQGPVVAHGRFTRL